MASNRVYLHAASAVTPRFASASALWEAALAAAPAPHDERSSDHPALWSALVNATLDPLQPAQHPFAPVVLATTKGDIHAQLAWMRSPDPSASPRCLPSALNALHSLDLPSRPSYIVSTACTSGVVGLIEAALLVRSGECPTAVTIAADTASSFVQDGFTALKARASSACRPFDAARDGLLLGSAAAGCRVSSQSAGALARVAGFGITNDATHLTAPDRHANGLIRAIRLALAMANLAPSNIDAIVAHGTGTRYNDAMEATAFTHVFSLCPPITAFKGMIGHTLGASGLIECVLAVTMLRHQIIPPIAGLRDPEYAQLPFIIHTPRAAALRHVLKVASGFGGMNAAIILSLTEGDA